MRIYDYTPWYSVSLKYESGSCREHDPLLPPLTGEGWRGGLLVPRLHAPSLTLPA
jgi:hypothetical protein